MGLFKRVSAKVRKVGQRGINQVSIGSRKLSNTVKKIQPFIAKAGKIANMIGVATGQPEIIALGEGLTGASAVASKVGKIAGSTHSGVEKLRKRHTAKEGAADIFTAAKEGYGMFGK